MAQADSVPSAIQAPITGASAKRSTKRRFADRRYFIGGSDARIIMGEDEGALLRLWREKRGEVEPEDLSGNLVVQLGVATEDLNRRWYQANSGQVLTDVQRRIRHPALRWMAATLDRQRVSADLRRFGPEGGNLADILLALGVSTYRTRLACVPKPRRHRRTICRAELPRLEIRVCARAKCRTDVAGRYREAVQSQLWPAGSWNNVLPQQSAGVGRATIRIPSGDRNHNHFLSDIIGLTTNRHAETQGSTIEISRSAKCRTFRVANVAWRASAIPAIWVSRMSTGRPLFCRAAASDAASVAAALSKSKTRFSKSSRRSRSNSNSSLCRRRPDGSSARPKRASNNVMLVIQTDLAGWRSSHLTTAASGTERISAPRTLVSRIIT